MAPFDFCHSDVAHRRNHMVIHNIGIGFIGAACNAWTHFFFKPEQHKVFHFYACIYHICARI